MVELQWYAVANSELRARAHVSPFTHNDTRRFIVYVCTCTHTCLLAPSSPTRGFFFFSPLTKRSGHLQRVCLEPFTPCWVSHRNLLSPRLHPRGSRRENPSDLVAQEESPWYGPISLVSPSPCRRSFRDALVGEATPREAESYWIPYESRHSRVFFARACVFSCDIRVR